MISDEVKKCISLLASGQTESAVRLATRLKANYTELKQKVENDLGILDEILKSVQPSSESTKTEEISAASKAEYKQGVLKMADEYIQNTASKRITTDTIIDTFKKLNARLIPSKIAIGNILIRSGKWTRIDTGIYEIKKEVDEK